MDILNYKGYEIHATPCQLLEPSQWKIEIHIVVSRNDQIKSRQFIAGNRYETREEAVQHCFDFGKRIIDGGIVNFSVADL